jgi:hypothetical protein
MEQRPSWEANSFCASQEIPRILWNPEIYSRIHKSPPPVPITVSNNLTFYVLYMNGLMTTVKRQSEHVALIIIKKDTVWVVVTVFHSLIMFIYCSVYNITPFILASVTL